MHKALVSANWGNLTTSRQRNLAVLHCNHSLHSQVAISRFYTKNNIQQYANQLLSSKISVGVDNKTTYSENIYINLTRRNDVKCFSFTKFMSQLRRFGKECKEVADRSVKNKRIQKK